MQKKIISLLIMVGMIVGISTVAIAIPKAINIQGKLTDSNGVPVNGAKDFYFKFWDAAVGGVQSGTTFVQRGKQVANGIFSFEISLVSDAQGNTNVDFNKDLWVEIFVDGNAAGNSIGRQKLSSVPYALNAEKLGGMTAKSTGADAHVLLTRADGSLGISGGGYEKMEFTTEGALGGLAKGRIILSGQGIGMTSNVKLDGNNYVRDDATKPSFMLAEHLGNAAYEFRVAEPAAGNINAWNTAMVIKSNGNVGIGTAQPGAKLQVEGDISYSGRLISSGQQINMGNFVNKNGDTMNGILNMTTGATAGYDSPVPIVYGIRATGTSAAGSFEGTGSGYGVYGVGNTGPAVYGRSQSNAGVYGASNTGRGVHGSSQSNAGVYGETVAGTGTDAGVHGKSVASTGYSGYFEGGKGLLISNESGVLTPQLYLNERTGAWSRLSLGASSVPNRFWTIASKTDATAANSKLNFYYRRDANNGSDYMTITGDGKVGIRTTSPSQALEVAGNAKITGTLEVGVIKDLKVTNHYGSVNDSWPANNRLSVTVNSVAGRADIYGWGNMDPNVYYFVRVNNSFVSTDSVVLLVNNPVGKAGRLAELTLFEQGAGYFTVQIKLNDDWRDEPNPLKGFRFLVVN